MTQSQERTNQLDLQEQESQESPNLAFNRRQFMGFGAAAAAALILPKGAQANSGILGGRGTLLAKGSTCTPPSLTKPSDSGPKGFFQPKPIASTPTGDYCTLTSDLEIFEQPYPAGSSTYVRAIRKVDTTPAAFQPGPTLVVNPGDLINLNVTNKLPADKVPPSTGEKNVESTYCQPNAGAFPIGDYKHNTPGCFNRTNLHFHGLHVSPISVGYKKGDTSKTPVYVSSGDPSVTNGDVILTESSDDVLYDLKPTKSNKYCPWLPAFHAPGTHWYHAHHHGSTAIQASSGIAGALIVQEPAGQEICKGAPDVVMVIQEEPQSLSSVEGSYVANLTPQEQLDRGIYERPGAQCASFLVNGKFKPTLKVQKGEIQRWRLINATATPRAFTLLQLQDSSGNPVVLYRIAVDGITLYGKKMDDPSVKVTQVPFAPGNRVDFLANLDSGTYSLYKLEDSTQGKASQAQLLATIKVSNTAYENAQQVKTSFDKLVKYGIPTTGQPGYLQSITTTPTANNTPVVFQIPNFGAAPADRVTTAGRGDFRITNTKYDPSNLGKSANIKADLNSTQEWIIANTSGAAHPFHIHVNPFLVVATATIDNTTKKEIGTITGTDSKSQQKIYNLLNDLTTWKTSDDPAIWWDTFAIAPGTAYKIQHRFDDYWGTYVLHCHILIHEDQGMMWNVQVNNVDGKGANPCQQLLTPVVISSSTKY